MDQWLIILPALLIVLMVVRVLWTLRNKNGK